MPASEKTRTCPETGKRLVRGVRPVEFSYKGRTIILDQPGWYAEDDGPESLHDGDDILATEEAFQTFKAAVDGILPAKEIRRIRKRLRLSQLRAGGLLGGRSEGGRGGKEC